MPGSENLLNLQMAMPGPPSGMPGPPTGFPEMPAAPVVYTKE